MPTPEQSQLCARIRNTLKTPHPVREVRMFGAIAFMVDERMVVAAHKNGDLLVRVDPQQSAALLCRDDTRQAEMGTGRAMGPGWLVAEGPLSEEQTAFWLGVAMTYHAQSGSSA
ncbi:MAG: hypothetical protein CR993_06700 [Rhodobacterales bacterium]|nr:MAG: hypothetical protein CR993_06700 [Rhodobacterales bacterium]